MINRVRDEPVITVGVITTLVTALLTLTNVFGLTAVTDAQRDALVAAVLALWPILLVIRQLVSPAYRSGDR